MILVLTSNQTNRQLIKSTLEKGGHKVIYTDKEISPDLIIKQQIKLVIADNSSTQSESDTTTTDLRRIAPNMKIIALNDQLNSFDKNASQTLLKPFTSKELEKSVEDLLAVDPLYHFYFYTKN